MNEYVIRRAEWPDRDKIFDFYRLAYPDWERRIPERWDWQITENPYRSEGPPTVWLALSPDEQVVGQTMAMMEPLQIEGEEISFGWSVDAFVAESYRGQGIGRRLKEAMNRDLEAVMAISMADTIRHINLTQGALSLPVLETYLLHGDPQLIVRSLAESKQRLVRMGAKALGVPGTMLMNSLSNQRRRQARKHLPQLEMEEVTLFPEELDGLWTRWSHHFVGSMVRDSRYLNWKFGAQPHVHYICFLVRHRGVLAGYLVLRKARERGILVDCLLDPDDSGAMMAVLEFTVAYFHQQGTVEVRAGSSFPPFQDCLRRAGWSWPIDRRTPLLHMPPGSNRKALTEGHWLFSLGDHDLQQ